MESAYLPVLTRMISWVDKDSFAEKKESLLVDRDEMRSAIAAQNFN
jgi:hypothetical protein